MRLVIQRVSEASVTIDGRVNGSIGKGYMVLVGACNSDTREIVEKMTKKMLNLRIFEDENGKTNKSLADVNGGVLLVSQFTLYADCRHGNRPGFTEAGSPAHAKEMYEYMVELCRKDVPLVGTGEFGADMKVALINDGPFTICLDSAEICPEK